MDVGIITGRIGPTGTGVYSHQLFANIKKQNDVNVSLIQMDHLSKRIVCETNNSDISELVINIPFPHKYLFYAYAIKKIPKYDLLHFTSQNLSYLATRNSVVTCLDLIHEVYPENFYHPVVAKILYRGLETPRHLIAISYASKEDLVKYHNINSRKIHVTHLAVDTSRFHPIRLTPNHYFELGLKSNRKYILQLGSGTKRKNLQGTLKSILHLKKEGKLINTKFLIAGKFQYKSDAERVNQLVEKLGLSDFVKFIGHLSGEQLPILFNIADVFVFPSFYEGFGLPILEAMACGTPVIASNVSSMPEVLGDAGILVNPHSTAEIAEGIHSILNDSNLSSNLSEKGLSRVSKFSWANTAKKTLEVYGLFR